MDYYRIMAIDVGDVRIGIALTDELRMCASPFESYKRVGIKRDIEHLLKIASSNNVKKIVCGLPLKLDGTDSLTTKKVRSFFEKLDSSSDIEMQLYDERMTTYEADEILSRKKIFGVDRKKSVDMIAAAVILDSYLLENKENKIMEKERDVKEEIFDEMEGDIVEFETEDGQIVEFEHICTIEYKEKDYFLFSPLESTDDLSNEEVAIFTLDKDENGELIYQLVDDEELLNEVYNEYVEIMNEYDGCDCGDDDCDGNCNDNSCSDADCKSCGCGCGKE